MKRLVRVLFLVSCFAMACTALPALAADTPDGLVEKNGKYYYYENGEKVTNTLKTITTNGTKDYYYFGKKGAAYTERLKKIKVTSGEKTTYHIYYFKANGKAVKNKWKTIKGYKYYFKSNGRAVCASTTMNSKYNVTTATIDDTKYGFDSQGHLASGVYLSESGKFYFFSTKKGVYNSTKTKKLRKIMKTVKPNTDMSSLLEQLNKYEGKYKKRTLGNDGGSCLMYGATDVFYKYKHFTIAGYMNPGSSTELLYQMYPD